MATKKVELQENIQRLKGREFLCKIKTELVVLIALWLLYTVALYRTPTCSRISKGCLK